LRAVPVATGLRNWRFVEVAKGLKEGDLVTVTLDRPEIREGALVTVTGEAQQ